MQMVTSNGSEVSEYVDQVRILYHMEYKNISIEHDF